MAVRARRGEDRAEHDGDDEDDGDDERMSAPVLDVLPLDREEWGILGLRLGEGRGAGQASVRCQRHDTDDTMLRGQPQLPRFLRAFVP